MIAIPAALHVITTCRMGPYDPAASELWAVTTGSSQHSMQVALRAGHKQATPVEARLQALLRRREEGEAACSPTRHDADLCHRIILWHESTNERVSSLHHSRALSASEHMCAMPFTIACEPLLQQAGMQE